MKEKAEIGYDSGCIFCTHSINWLRRHDRHGRLSYKALPSGASCVTLQDKSGDWKASTAALRALGHLGGMWSVSSKVLLMIPRPIRDRLYCIIARHRHITGSEGVQNNAE